ncbi:MAG: hypothetical protein HOH48_05480 [Candidatus Puniceispirillum sp.]|jgi:hypothetical protein|uniref:hypothetical protein n=1 Tax=Candidatus Puniceispirillum sp. TaxID=2026719 RepID=UPI001EC6F2BA|nr:hypothetical protein [Candidatus Puniceispirillum sp.]MBT6414947.1 hypothetical protein [Candidatus Puniceispirillum sp.]MBT6566939.1 hypothetical protein [Candidatus Puniceispirillum sp.]
MLDFLFLISAKPVVVTLATIGAILATFSAAIEKFITDKKASNDPSQVNTNHTAKPAHSAGDTTDKKESHLPRSSFGSWLNRLGYGIMAISVVLFIIAGFIVDLRG